MRHLYLIMILFSYLNCIGQDCSNCNELKIKSRLADYESYLEYYKNCFKKDIVYLTDDNLSSTKKDYTKVEYKSTEICGTDYLYSLFYANKKTPILEYKISNNDTIYSYLDSIAEFPKGLKALEKFIKQKFKYPENSKKYNVTGQVNASFIIDQNGNLQDLYIVKGLNSECNNEVIRILKLMPPWKPATHNGRKVKSLYILPFNFSLD